MIDGGRAVGKAGLDAVPTVANRVIRASRNHRGDLTPLVAPHLNRLYPEAKAHSQRVGPTRLTGC